MGTKHESDNAVICPVHGSVPLTREQYIAQLELADEFWRCPKCGEAGFYDEDNDPSL